MTLRSDTQRKAMFAKMGQRGPRKGHAVVIAHVGGPSGAGKTTLGKQLARRFPGLTVKDLDEFSKPSISPHSAWKKAVKGRYQGWLRRQRGPVVLVGLEREGPAANKRVPVPLPIMPIPASAQLYRLKTWPVVSTFRQVKRQWQHNRTLLGMKELRGRYRFARRDRNQYDRLGYRRMSAQKIEDAIGKQLSKSKIMRKE